TLETLEDLAQCAKDRDVVFIDEVHLQSRPVERRGVTVTPGSEVFLSLLEDKRLTVATGMIPFPNVTPIGATTEAGLLPEPFLMRWSLQPRIDPYTIEDMVTLADYNAKAPAGLQSARDRSCEHSPAVARGGHCASAR